MKSFYMCTPLGSSKLANTKASKLEPIQDTKFAGKL